MALIPYKLKLKIQKKIFIRPSILRLSFNIPTLLNANFIVTQLLNITFLCYFFHGFSMHQKIPTPPFPFRFQFRRFSKFSLRTTTKPTVTFDKFLCLSYFAPRPRWYEFLSETSTRVFSHSYTPTRPVPFTRY